LGHLAKFLPIQDTTFWALSPLLASKSAFKESIRCRVSNSIDI
jgi:hypothetical protein